jgi:hypothetical protein
MVLTSFCFKFTIHSLHYSLAHVSLQPVWDSLLIALFYHTGMLHTACKCRLAQLANSIEFYSGDHSSRKSLGQPQSS